MTAAHAEAVTTAAAAEFAAAMAAQTTAGVGALETFHAQLLAGEVDGQALDLAATAVDVMTQLGATFGELKTVLEGHLVVGDAYAATNNEAGDKRFSQADATSPARATPQGDKAARTKRTAHECDDRDQCEICLHGFYDTGIRNEAAARRYLRAKFNQGMPEPVVQRPGAYFYVTARTSRRSTALLLGPYVSHMTALSAVARARSLGGDDLAFAAVGTASITGLHPTTYGR